MGFRAKLHKALPDVAGSQGSHDFALVGVQGLLSTAAPGVGTLLLVNGRMYATPFYVPRRRPFSGANIRVTTAGTVGAVARFGVYRTQVVQPLPGALAFESGDVIATDTIGLKSHGNFPGGAFVLDEGIYWFVIVGQGTPATQATLSAATGRNPFFVVGGDPALPDQVGVRSLAATHLGALPDPFGTPIYDSTPMPRATMQ